MTIANAPPDKLVEMREKFEEIWDEVYTQAHSNNMFYSEKDCEELFLKLHEKI
eukprot:CAMPEP_0202966682 /NCGR_PEP_ID=MMETSP1396-20130829/11228_1 /ASSEMBLY_ACC=CAM_ASM_000872 /TAXON_ID= /ORGANISM="Pseudokeronopsis sp., Strain Brazil" /LENGTH=52 /DNA_ID=CAMNT_0049690863 /DNA_START=370 /DNA_END=528 /DNA_ORIENTATION=-